MGEVSLLFLILKGGSLGSNPLKGETSNPAMRRRRAVVAQKVCFPSLGLEGARGRKAGGEHLSLLIRPGNGGPCEYRSSQSGKGRSGASRPVSADGKPSKRAYVKGLARIIRPGWYFFGPLSGILGSWESSSSFFMSLFTSAEGV